MGKYRRATPKSSRVTAVEPLSRLGWVVGAIFRGFLTFVRHTTANNCHRLRDLTTALRLRTASDFVIES